MSESIKKRRSQADINESANNKIREVLKCECQHKTKDGNPTIVPLRDKSDPFYPYVCTQCKKPIHIKRVVDETIDDSIQIVDSLIDVVKMIINENSTEDEELLKKLRKAQYTIRNVVRPAYRSALKSQERGKNRNRNTNSSGTTIQTRHRHN